MAQGHLEGHYYTPHGSAWPIRGTVGMMFMAIGGALWLNHIAYGSWVLLAGTALVLWMVFGWFGDVIHESLSGLYNEQVDRSFRWGMGWFIFSEVCFFACFFGALFYTRFLAVEWLSGHGDKALTGTLLWPSFEGGWPTNGPAQLGVHGEGSSFTPMGWWPLPAINTAILVTSSWTLTWAHHALKEGKQRAMIIGLAATVALGILFLFLQAKEYGHAYAELGLTMGTGIYGATFFMMTGFHGFHVTLGSIMLLVMLIRAVMGHFKPESHFAFEATAWYWHFVDVVWLCLFVLVYIA